MLFYVCRSALNRGRPGGRALLNLVKGVVRAVLGPKAVGWLGAKYIWGKTFLNYALMRLPFGSSKAQVFIEGRDPQEALTNVKNRMQPALDRYLREKALREGK